MKLGAILLFSFALALSLRRPLERRVVGEARASVRSKRQLVMDFALVMLAGLAATTYSTMVWGFPTGSGLSLLLGFLAAAFFASLDTALARERSVITTALSETGSPPPRRFISMTRKFSLVALLTALFVTLILFLVISKDLSWLSHLEASGRSLAQARWTVMLELLFTVGALGGLLTNLILSYSGNLRLLFNNQTGVLEKVRQGDLTQFVPVATSDEFGVIAAHTNSMIRGLKHRQELLSELKLGEELQQNLLPDRPPAWPGLEIAAKSHYSSQTGGDYFDFFELCDGRLGVVVADAAGHGVDAALHMTTARALLRSRMALPGSPAAIINDVNRHLTVDMYRTSRFMTLFFLVIDPRDGRLTWVRAGHEPAICYDPAEDRFDTLVGNGLALGVDGSWHFEENARTAMPGGGIVVLATDGIWEARNAKGEMFGKEPLYRIVREQAEAGAEAVLSAVLAALARFRGKRAPDDDATLVVIRTTDVAAGRPPQTGPDNG